MNAVQTYKEHSIETENRGRIIVLLYDGAIQFLRRAQESIRLNDYTAKSHCIGRARDIVMELNQSLDLQEGGPLAQNLRSLYNFLWRFLGEINISNDVKMIDKAIGILDDLGGAWKKIT